MLQELSRELDRPKEDKSVRGALPRLGNPNPAGPATPISVEVRQPDPGAPANLQTPDRAAAQPARDHGHHHLRHLHLDQRQDLRNRLIRAFRSHGLQTTDSGVGRCREASQWAGFFAPLMINATFGVIIGVGLTFIGIPGVIVRPPPWAGLIPGALPGWAYSRRRSRDGPVCAAFQRSRSGCMG